MATRSSSDTDPIKTKHATNDSEGVTRIPLNLFRKEPGRNVFRSDLEEKRAWEQFFWTAETVDGLMKACRFVYETKTCCLFTPSLAYAWHHEGRDETLLDIDTRFASLPSFRYYDVTDPYDLDKTFRLLILDPPFFSVPIEVIRDAVDRLTGGDFSTKLIIGFLTRAEWRLRTAFKPYCLKPTDFRMTYASIKPNKWKNFTLYSNIDLPGIRRKKE